MSDNQFEQNELEGMLFREKAELYYLKLKERFASRERLVKTSREFELALGVLQKKIRDKEKWISFLEEVQKEK